MTREIKRFSILAINMHGAKIKMEIVERDGMLMLWNGLDQQTLTLPAAWTWRDIEREVKRLSGVTRMVMCQA